MFRLFGLLLTRPSRFRQLIRSIGISDLEASCISLWKAGGRDRAYAKKMVGAVAAVLGIFCLAAPVVGYIPGLFLAEADRLNLIFIITMGVGISAVGVALVIIEGFLWQPPVFLVVCGVVSFLILSVGTPILLGINQYKLLIVFLLAGGIFGVIVGTLVERAVNKGQDHIKIKKGTGQFFFL